MPGLCVAELLFVSVYRLVLSMPRKALRPVEAEGLVMRTTLGNEFIHSYGFFVRMCNIENFLVSS